MSFPINKSDSAIIVHWSNQEIEDGLGEFEPETIRPPAPFALNEVFVKRQIPSTVFNYGKHWSKDVLVDTILKWCKNKNVSNPILIISSFNAGGMFDPELKFQNFVKLLKSKLNFLFLMGGPYHGFTVHDGCIKPDYLFSGRSLHLLEHWIDGDIENIEDYVLLSHGIKRIRPKTSEVVEHPIVPKLYDDYCLTENDVLSFEVRIGCKFNCTFCNFEHRNAKQVSDASDNDIYEFLSTAQEKYGINYFNMCDDTANEDMEKLDILSRATSKLNKKPLIGGFSRFDLLIRNPKMIEKMDQIGYHSHWFGIESMHKEANKLLRKTLGREEITKNLKYLNENYPHWDLCASMIIGLPKEPMDHTWSVFKENIKEKYLSNVFTYVLDVIQLDHNFASDIMKQPEKFGITIRDPEVIKEDHVHLWEHEESNSESATLLHLKIEALNRKSGLKKLDPWQILTSKSLGVDLNLPIYRDVNHPEYNHNNILRDIVPAMNKHIENYISKKIIYTENC